MKRAGVRDRNLPAIITLPYLLMVMGFIFSATAVLHGSDTAEQIEAEIQKVKDAGEPTSIEELVPPDIPDERNGAQVYEEAFSILKELRDKHKEEWKYLPYEGEVKWKDVPESERKKVRNLLLADPDFVKFYKVIEKASGMECRFIKREEYRKGAALPLPHLASLRSCARMLAARAFILTETGRIDSGLRDCLTGLKISASLSREPILISGLVRIAVDTLILGQLKETLKKGEPGSRICRTLIEKTGKEMDNDMLYRALLGERVIFGMREFPRLMREVEENKNIEPIKELLEYGGKDKEKKTESFLKVEDGVRFLEDNELLYLRALADWIALSRKPYWEARDRLPEMEENLKKFPDEEACLVKLLIPAFSRIFIQEARADAQLGNAEIALACHLYRTKYKVFPDSLEKLTPQFLKKLSLDPFTGKDYIYRKKDNGFVVYSVGDNLKDDGGVPQSGEKGKQADFDIVWEE